MQEYHIAEAARLYVELKEELKSADSTSFMTKAADEAAAYHELVLALGLRCDCQPGTCVGAPLEDDDVDA